jgi:hypothetical protein
MPVILSEANAARFGLGVEAWGFGPAIKPMECSGISPRVVCSQRQSKFFTNLLKLD